MTVLTGVLFFLAVCVLLLITLPFALMAWEMDDLRANIKFWAIVVAFWVAVWFALGVKTT